MTWRENNIRNDTIGVPSLEGTGIIEAVDFYPASKETPLPRYEIRVRIGSRRGYAPVPIAQYPQSAVRQRVRVTYQVGKSGYVYIGKVEPE